MEQAASKDWDTRVDALWAAFDEHSGADFIAKMRSLADELPAGDPRAPFELGGAYDSTGQPEQAVPQYRKALDSGLAGSARRQATIQLASTLRNLGRVDESVELLSRERAAGSDELDDAVAAFLALALSSAGRDREALSLALAALARHLPRYNRSLANYARALVEEK